MDCCIKFPFLITSSDYYWWSWRYKVHKTTACITSNSEWGYF